MYVHSATRFIRENRKCLIRQDALINFAVNTECSKHLLTCNFLSRNARSGRFFIFTALYLFISTNSSAASDSSSDFSCPTSNYHETTNVKRVIDGDTVILDDNRHIRLIGINTPEIDHDGKNSQAGAKDAQIFLRKLINKNSTVHLIYDTERLDRYNRTLAHLFSLDGTNIQGKILRHGLAVPLTIPPNLLFSDCYQNITLWAQENKKGLWSLPDYQPILAEKVSPSDTGYRIINGKVKNISQNNFRINISIYQNISILIDKADLQYFIDINLSALKGKTIQIRGWLRYKNKMFKMKIRHPADLKYLMWN